MRPGQPRPGGVAAPPAGREALGGRGPGHQRALVAAAQREHAADALLRLRDALHLAPAAVPVDHLAPGAGRPGQVAGQLRAHREALEQLEPDRVGAAVEIERALVQLGRVAVRVDGGRGGRGLGQGRAGRLDVACAEPVPRTLGRRSAGLLERRGDRGVQGAAARPRNGVVDGVAHERMPEGDAAWAVLDQQTARERLAEPVRALQARHVRDDAALARNRGDLEGVSPRQRQRLGAQQHGVEHRVRQGEPPRLGAASLEAERGGQLLDVERDAVGAVVERLDGVRVEVAAGDRRREAGGALAVERLERQLDEVAHAAQLRAQPAQPLRVGGHLVPRRDHEQQRHLAQLGRERGEQVERRLVSPVEIVEQDRDRAGSRHRAERAPERLDQGRGPRVGRGRTELRQQMREVRDERSARLRHVGPLPQALAQHLRHRAVRLGHVGPRRAGVGDEPGLPQGVHREAALADAGLAGDEHATTRTTRRDAGGGGERCQFLIAPDQLSIAEHDTSLDRRRGTRRRGAGSTAVGAVRYGSPPDVGPPRAA